jgi:hypothetical protein
MAKVTSQCPHCSAWQVGAVSHRTDATRARTNLPKSPKPKAKPKQAAPKTPTDDEEWAKSVLRSVGFLWGSDIDSKLGPYINERARKLHPRRRIRWWWHVGSTLVFVLSVLVDSFEEVAFLGWVGAAIWWASIGGHAWVAARADFARSAAQESKERELRKVIGDELHVARLELLRDGPFGPSQAPPPGPQAQGVDDEQAERLCAKWLANLGEKDVSVTRAKSDGGVDVISSRCVAQVKNYKGSVGVAPVRELVGVASIDGRFPVFFTSGSYSKAAKQFAEEAKVYLFRYDAKAGTLDAESSIAEKAFAK